MTREDVNLQRRLNATVVAAIIGVDLFGVADIAWWQGLALIVWQAAFTGFDLVVADWWAGRRRRPPTAYVVKARGHEE